MARNLHLSMSRGMWSGLTLMMLALLVILSLFFDYEERTLVFNLPILEFRGVHTLGILCLGGTCGLLGAICQRLLNNPLVDGHILGVASGGQVLLLVATVYGWQLGIQLPILLNTYLWILAGCLVTSVFFLGLLRWVDTDKMYLLPLFGFMLNGFWSGVSSLLFVDYSSPFVQAILAKLSGHVTIPQQNEIFWILGLWVIFILLLFAKRRNMMILSLGQNEGILNGLKVQKELFGVILLLCLFATLVVSVFGFVGYLGIFVPHQVRKIARTEQGVWVGSLILGGIVLLGLDFIVKFFFYPRNIPLGSVVGLVGIPLLVLQFLKHKNPQMRA